MQQIQDGSTLGEEFGVGQHFEGHAGTMELQLLDVREDFRYGERLHTYDVVYHIGCATRNCALLDDDGSWLSYQSD